jgi:hypothetical protein
VVRSGHVGGSGQRFKRGCVMMGAIGNWGLHLAEESLSFILGVF